MASGNASQVQTLADRQDLVKIFIGFLMIHSYNGNERLQNERRLYLSTFDHISGYLVPDPFGGSG